MPSGRISLKQIIMPAPYGSGVNDVFKFVVAKGARPTLEADLP